MKRTLRNRLALGLMASAVAAAWSSTGAFAASWTWNGSQGNANWTNTPNWTPVGPVANDGTADVVFGTTGATIQFSPNMNANWSIHSVTFNNTAAAYTLVSTPTAFTLTLGAGGISENSANTQTINNAITLGAAQTWNTAAGNLVLNGAVNNGGNLLTFNAAAGTVPSFSGMISGAGGLTKIGSGTLLLNGNSTGNTFTGPVNVNDGTLLLNKVSGRAFSSTILNVGDGIGAAGSAIVQSSGGNTPSGFALSIQADGNYISSSETISGLTMTGGTVDIAGVLFTVSGDVTTLASSSTATIAAGTNDSFNFNSPGTHSCTVAQGTTPTGVDLDISAPLSSFSGPFIKAGPGTMRLSTDNSAWTTGSLTVNAGTLLIGNDAALGPGALTINGGVIQADGSLHTVSNAVTFAGIGTFGGAFDLTVTGPVSGPGGLVKNGSSTLTLAGTNDFTGPITVNAGTLVMSASTSLTGNVTNFGTFVYNGGSFSGRLINGGAVTLNADLTAGNGIENDSSLTLAAGRTITLNGAGLNNQGTFSMNGGSLFLSTSGTANNVNNGTFLLSAPLNLAAATLSNSGTFGLSGGTLMGTGTFNNAIGGTVAGFGTIAATTFNNSAGTLYAQGGTIHLSNAISNAGTIQVAAGATLNGAAITNTGSILGAGTLSNNVTNNGSIEPVGGTFIISGILTNTAAGTIFATIGNKILVQSGLATNAGTIDLAGGTFDNGNNPLNNTGSIVGYGSLRTGGAGLANNGSVLFAGGSTTINGLVTNSVGRTIEVRNTPALFTNNVNNAAGGVFKSTNTTVTFLGTFTGSLTSDPATNLFRADVTIPPANAFTGGVGDVFNFAGGTFTNNGTFTNGGSLQSSDPTTNSGTFTQSGPQSWSAGSTFTNTAGSATINSDAGSASAAPLNIVDNGGTVTFASDEHLASLTVGPGATTAIATPSSHANRHVLVTGALSIASGGTLDIGGNDALVHNGNLTTLTSQVRSGFASGTGGTWTGPGLTSSAAAADVNHVIAIGLKLVTSPGTFDGQTTAVNDVLIKETFFGDSDLNGSVNAADYSSIDNGYAVHLTGWVNGDFNYDGVTNAADYSLIDTAFAFQSAAGGPLDATLPLATALTASPDSATAVPEPAAPITLTLTATLLFLSRKRNRRMM